VLAVFLIYVFVAGCICIYLDHKDTHKESWTSHLKTLKSKEILVPFLAGWIFLPLAFVLHQIMKS